ncbi:hypothetical protein HMPREF0762_01616 [Slackia exigua ATCC 700122]|uniref:Uncharacterized protein n=1 Tax=Slackia exigua (strain ATCC 700122 / DSM 15923 / CIP 105133 / JCM 11022 / KCTC 5966 / S-7) TaxID=649764 RepID=D0WIE1_SLAES|nr:hypothetical protein HMPREF0762_01616 [Slackia exigua ATCC 700122]
MSGPYARDEYPSTCSRLTRRHRVREAASYGTMPSETRPS